MKLGTIARRVSVALLIASLVCGCASSPNARYAERRMNQRVKGLGRTVDTYVDGEVKRSEQLARDFEYIGDEIAKDARQFDRSLRWWDAQIRFQFERFAKRGPDYWRELARIFGGKPHRLERNAIDLFY